MRTGNILFSAVQFLFAMAMLCSGAVIFAIPWAPAFRLKIAEFFFTKEALFIPLGAALFGIGLVLMVGFYFMYRRQYYKVHLSTVEIALLRSIVSVYWKKIFPQDDLVADLFIHKDQKLELIVEVPSLSVEEHEKLLEKIENEIGTLLANQLGYKADLLVTVVIK